MFESLDTFIAAAAVILGLSLLVQAIQQLIKQAWNLKSDYMRKELLAMFVDDGHKRTGLDPITTLKDMTHEQAGKLIGTLQQKMKSMGFKDLELLENIDGQKVKEIFKSLPVGDVLQAAGVHVTMIQKEIEDEIDRWFELTKQAFQDHYERRMKAWAFGISALVVVVVNANLPAIYTDLSTNKPARDAIVQSAPTLLTRAETIMKQTPTPASKNPADHENTNVNADSLAKSDTLIRVYRAMMDTLLQDKSLKLYRWDVAGGDSLWLMPARPLTAGQHVGIWVAHVWGATAKNFLGWLAMALLVSLGAPVWYDVLKSLMGVKNLLKSKSTGSESGNGTTGGGQ